MPSENVCRVCLDSDVAMYNIVNTELQETYESISNTMLDAGDGRPMSVCYICCSQLWRCNTFSKISRKSDQILTTLLQNGYEVSKDTINLLNYSNGMQKKISVNLVAHYEVLPSKQGFENSFKRKEDIEDTKIGDGLHEERQGIEKGIQIKKEQTEDTKVGDGLNEGRQGIEKDIKIKKEQNKISDGLDEGETYEIDIKPCSDTHSNTEIQLEKRNRRCKYSKAAKQKEYWCSKCKKPYNGIRKYNLHMNLHREKHLVCDVCPRRFNKLSNLNKHKIRHTKERPFLCEVCGMAFKIKGHVDRHMLVHTKERPFICDLCKKTFRNKESLKAHLHIGHTGLKPYTCNLCTKSFTQKGMLKYHHRVHSREWHYSCTSCKKKFYDKRSLDRHTAEQNPDGKGCKGKRMKERPYVCEVCGKAYAKRSILKKHTKNKHVKSES